MQRDTLHWPQTPDSSEEFVKMKKKKGKYDFKNIIKWYKISQFIIFYSCKTFKLHTKEMLQMNHESPLFCGMGELLSSKRTMSLVHFLWWKFGFEIMDGCVVFSIKGWYIKLATVLLLKFTYNMCVSDTHSVSKAQVVPANTGGAGKRKPVFLFRNYHFCI